ncbi:MAG TPA: ATP-binding protein [bacterium]|nr:ATP-binding protein [bacterium]
MKGKADQKASDPGFLAAELEKERARAAELERSNEELRRRDRQKDEFIGNVSHELRTSLASVKNVIANALAGVSGELPDKLRRSLLIADENIKRFSNIINDLLDMARLESGKMAMHRSPVDPVRVVAGVVASFEEEAAKRGINLSSSWEVPPMFVFMDGDRIAQVVGNLIGNALKFTPWGGKVGVRGLVVRPDCSEISGDELRSMPEDAAFAIEVSDTGPGIEGERIERIFDRFEQSETRANDSHDEGLGLGLAICKQIVALHHGKIWAKNREGGGTQFVFTIPFMSNEETFLHAVSDRLRIAGIHHYPLSLVLVDFACAGSPDTAPSEETVMQIETLLRQVLRRKSDTLMWRGDGRFAVILPQTTVEEARAVSRRIFEATAQARWTSGSEAVRLMARFAVAGTPGDPDTAEEFIAAAESRLVNAEEPSESSWSEVI